LYSIKVKNIHSSKDPLRERRKIKVWEKILANHLPNRELYPKSVKNSQNSIKLFYMGIRFKQIDHQRYLVANKPLNRCLNH
jgi:hypothetical protein